MAGSVKGINEKGIEMKTIKYIYLIALLLFFPTTGFSVEDELELDTTYIKGNKELPQIMYVVPWQDMKTKQGKKAAQNLTLHSLFGNIFDPVMPEQVREK